MAKTSGLGKSRARKPPAFIPCSLKALPEKLLAVAAATAVEFNPANRVPVERLASLGSDPGKDREKLAIAFLTTKLWGSSGAKLGVYFMDTQDSNLKGKILAHANAWGQSANVQFVEASSSSAQIRVARQRGQGYYSYLGVDCLHIPKNQPTMNLEAFTLTTPQSEYNRVVKHEFGHALGAPHEHMRQEIVARLDVQKTIAYFRRTQGWSEQEVRQQVLTPLDERSIMGTPADVTSIMTYQLPGSITVDGQPIPGGNDINPSDAAYCGKVYPLSVQPPPPPPGKVTITVPRAGTYEWVS